ncbi:MAG: glycosyltransferase [Nitrospinaceae bacterium]|nr:glycosyltransferase [Nitrospinaceae bacterium]MBT3823312.1 glycosyltransferase [Nitrospinaceae bacterium]MBT4092391.1 glycosyltransferase [Nitrospinaceae bacterium]MBT4431463.1 glycosyltransferase [Nitrospinaceae bacterium]MBT5367394.1 glycosyltransferase [Nitrospinaceae bacterium]
MTKKKSISIFVSAYNEAENLLDCVLGITAAAEAQFEDYEVIIVNDGSTDGTGEVAEGLRQDNGRIRVIHNPGNLGFARSFCISVEEAEKEFYAFFPGDGEIAASSVAEIISLAGTADIIAPYHDNSDDRSLMRQAMSRTCSHLTNFLLGYNLRYYQGPPVYRTADLKLLPKKTPSLFLLTEMMVHALYAGRSYKEIGFVFEERKHGESKAVSIKNIWIAFYAILRLCWDIRIRKTPPIELPERGGK